MRTPDGPEDLDRDALRVDPRIDEIERDVGAVLGEQPPALSEDNGDDKQCHLVDEIVLEQRLDELFAQLSGDPQAGNLTQAFADLKARYLDPRRVTLNPDCGFAPGSAAVVSPR